MQDKCLKIYCVSLEVVIDDMYNAFMQKGKQKVIIIGAGAVGSAIAYTLSQNNKFEITVLEKNETIPGVNQSSRNAGVIHAGIYYSKEKEPLKSRLCVEGNKLMYEFCAREGVPHKKVGKLIVATNEREKEYLMYFFESAKANKVPGIKIISEKEIKKLEPNLNAISAIYVPSSGIVDAKKLVKKYKELAEKNGAKFITSTEVLDIKPQDGGFSVEARSEKMNKSFTADIVINSAGLSSDVIAKMINEDSPYELLPTRGEFVQFENVSDVRVGMNVYPAPYGFYTETGEKAHVGLEEFLELYKQGIVTRTVGVHVTPTINEDLTLGSIAIVGPVKSVKTERDDYTNNLKDEEVYHEKISSYLPGIKLGHLKKHYTGIMASEKNFKDFIIEKDKNYPNFINLIGIDSPGMTSSLAIARHVAQLMD